MLCTQKHRYYALFQELPNDQGGNGRHKCAACAYERGLALGLKLIENIDIDLNTLPESQAGVVRHKSPHAAFALGYLEGVNIFYNN